MIAKGTIPATTTLFVVALACAAPASIAQPARGPSRLDAFPAVSVTPAEQAQGCTNTPLQMDMAEVGPLVEERFRKAGMPPPANLGGAVAFNLGGWASRYLGDRASRLSRTEGRCQDWQYIVSKWQQTVGTRVTGTVSGEDARKLFAYADAGDAPVVAQQRAQVQQRERDQAAAAAEAARDAAERGKAPSIFGIPFGHTLDLPKCGARPSVGQFVPATCYMPGHMVALPADTVGVFFDKNDMPPWLEARATLMAKDEDLRVELFNGQVAAIGFTARSFAAAEAALTAKFGKPMIEEVPMHNNRGASWVATRLRWSGQGLTALGGCNFEFGKGCSTDLRVRSEAILDRRIQEREREVQEQVRGGRKL